jgi:hypothetical protein
MPQMASLSTAHTITDMEHDARGLPSGSPVHNHFDGGHAAPYSVVMDIELMSKGAHPFFVFCEVDDENQYQLDFGEDSIYFTRKVNGVQENDVHGAAYAMPVGVKKRLVLQMTAPYTFKVRDGAGKLVLAWTDDERRFAYGKSMSYYTSPGGLVCWESVKAGPGIFLS